MSADDRDLLYVVHIQERIHRLEAITAQGRDAFNASFILQDAVIRNFEVIGEAVKQPGRGLEHYHQRTAWIEAGYRHDVCRPGRQAMRSLPR